MLMLNILLNSDGTFAWDNGLILLLALVAGYLLHRFVEKKSDNKKHRIALKEMEGRYQRLDSEYKSYKSNIHAAEKQAEKSVMELGHRVKALEGDIRVLSDDKNRLHDQLDIRLQEMKKNSELRGEIEDQFKLAQESWVRIQTGWETKLKLSEADIRKAMQWEPRATEAEAEGHRLKAALGQAERRKLEAELRLKATIEYASKIAPLETEIQMLKEKCLYLEKEVADKAETAVSLQRASAQLELMTQNNQVYRQEIEAKQRQAVALVAEIEAFKKNFETGVERDQKIMQ